VSSPRANRVPERIKEILAEAVRTLKDPRVGFVTITDVRTTPDFGKATVFWTVLGSPEDVPGRDDTDDAVVDAPEAEQAARQRTAEGLASATPVLRRELGRRMRLRQVPVLEFVHDPVPAHGRRIEALLDEARPDR
jgi:ribosome-binding factor A